MAVRHALATDSWGSEEKDALYSVIASGRHTMGEKVQQFEREFAEYVGSSHAVMVNSGSSANLLMCHALRYKSLPTGRRSRVVVPAVGWSTTYAPLVDWAELHVVDVDRDTWGFDRNGLRDALRHDPDLVLAVNLLGNPYSADVAMSVPLLEDNCESLGAKIGGAHAGTWGVMGSFSFFFSHHMSTMEGGMIVTDDRDLYHILLSLRAHGWTRPLPPNNRLCDIGDAWDEQYRFILPGFNVRPGEMHAAVGSEQLKKLPAFIQGRRDNARRFKSLMADHPHFETQKEVGESSWFGFGLVLAESAPWDRKHVIEVFHDHGIETRPIVAGNFTRQPVMRHYRHILPEKGLPNADRIHDRGFFIGNNPEPNDFSTLREALDAL